MGEDYQSEMLSKATDMSILPWALEAAREKPKSDYPQWENYSVTEDMVQVASVNLGVQIIGDSEAVTMTKLINHPGMDIAATLTELSERYNQGLYNQAKADEEKWQQSEVKIGFLGKIMAVEEFDPWKPISPEDIIYLTADEWKALQDN